MINTGSYKVQKQVARIECFDVLRVIAMVAVILNHSFGYFSIIKYAQYQNTLIWHIDNILIAFTRFDVPIFFMLSGALLLKRDSTLSLEHLFKIRIPRILIPLLTWNLIYIIIFKYNSGLNSIIKEFYSSIFLVRDYAGHLWYLYALIAIYLLSPLIKCFIDRANEKLINYALLIWITFSILIPFFDKFIPNISFPNYADLNILAGYLGYFILGYKLSNIKRTFNQKSLIIIFMLGWILSAVLGYFLQKYIKSIDTFFLGFLTPNVVIMSIAMFIFIKQLLKTHELTPKFKGVIVNISNLSFGIYLVHLLFKDAAVLVFEKYTISPILFLISCPIIVFIVSYVTIYIASNIGLLSFCITGNKYKKPSK